MLLSSFRHPDQFFQNGTDDRRHPIKTEVVGVGPVYRTEIGVHRTEKGLAVEKPHALVACGGNKARIVLKLIEDARSRGADAIVGYGNSRSNMCRVLAMLCAREGMPCTVVSPSDDGGARVETANSRIVRLCGAEVVACEKGSGVATVISGVMDRLSAAGRRPYYIFGDCRGVGNERVLSSAYEEVASAVCEWELEHGLAFDRVVVAAGGGTALCERH